MKRIFFDNATGEIILEIQPQNDILPSVERNIEQFIILSERNRETFEVIELPYGAYTQDFAIAIRYKVNIETKELVFQYIDENEPEVEQPFQPPLSEKIEELEATFMYDSMMKEMAIEESNTQHAELMYQLMMNGVL